MLGGINVNVACTYQYKVPGYGTILRSQNNVYGWRCGSSVWSASDVRGVDMARECRRVFGNAYADFLNFKDPYSWRCFR
ncbi:hypothetical protein BN1047_00110 [Mycolicibacterium neoaurum]|uniref:Secreted protein n=1 Tax=Mycolicibacterium neoaurum TaxID=1795 RepID=A0AAV2WD76_MYCNE|nr:hypothetical protein BN1047_00110 [Mycolicibacterium neoaurum]